MVIRQHLVIGLTVVGLILANLTLDVGLLLLLSASQQKWRWLNDAASGILVGQVILVGMYLGLGDGRWYVRAGAAVCLTLAIARTIGIAASLSEHERRNGDPDGWAAIAFLLIPMMLAASLVGLMLRRFRGWQLTWQSSVNELPTRQFQISDIMLWTTLVAGALAAIRILMTFDDHLPDQFLDLSLLAARTIVAVICGMITAFATANFGRTTILISLTLAVATAVLSVTDVFDFVQRALPGFRLSGALETVGNAEVFAFAAATGSLANCVALRMLGCKHIRRGTRSALLEVAAVKP